MRRALILLTLLACSVILGAAAAQAAPENAVSAAARARIVIGLQRTDQAGEVARSVDARILRRLVALRLVAATVDEDRRNEVLARLRSDPRVGYAEVDRRVRVVPPLIGRRCSCRSHVPPERRMTRASRSSTACATRATRTSTRPTPGTRRPPAPRSACWIPGSKPATRT